MTLKVTKLGIQMLVSDTQEMLKRGLLKSSTHPRGLPAEGWMDTGANLWAVLLFPVPRLHTEVGIFTLVASMSNSQPTGHMPCLLK